MATTIKLSTNGSFLLWNFRDSTVCFCFKREDSKLCVQRHSLLLSLTAHCQKVHFAPTLSLFCNRLVVIHLFALLMTASKQLWNGQCVKKYVWPLQTNTFIFGSKQSLQSSFIVFSLYICTWETYLSLWVALSGIKFLKTASFRVA